MERRLYEASLRGNVNTLKEILDEDPLILDTLLTGFNGTTPLHIVAVLNHVNFAREILSHKLSFTSELNSQGFSPLHLASVGTKIEMVQLLLEANPDVCILIDQEGRTPLHLAAMKGRIEIMKMLIQIKPEAIQVRSDQRETILHLCVKHNRFEALKLLVEYLVGEVGTTNHEPISVNSVDEDGNTILHLAVSRRQTKMVKYLLDGNIGIRTDVINNNNLTALGNLLENNSAIDEKEIEDLLRSAEEQVVVLVPPRNSTRSKTSEGNPRNIKPKKQKEKHNEQYKKWLRNMQNALMVVASLIATMAFQAGTNPPGGVWQDDSPISSTTNPGTFLYYQQKLGTDGQRSTNSSSNNFIRNELLNEAAKKFVKNPPGLVLEDIWGSPLSNHTGFSPYIMRYAGTSVLAYSNPRAYFTYIVSNTIGFLASLSIILLLVSGLPLSLRLLVWILMLIMWIAITAMALCYLVAVAYMSPPFYSFNSVLPTYEFVRGIVLRRDQNANIVSLVIVFWLGFLGLILLIHLIRSTIWLIWKLGSLIFMRKRRDH